MTLYDFIQMDEVHQAEAICKGVHIDSRIDGQHLILLYQINSTESFYVEVYIYKKKNTIAEYKAFSSVERLHALYAYKIDLVKLMSE